MSKPDELVSFPEKYFYIFDKYVSSNFWYKSRSKCIEFLLKRFGDSDERTFVEMGCGTGIVLSHLENKFIKYKFIGIELSESGYEFAKRRLERSQVLNCDFKEAPIINADYVGLFDVIEHIDDDTQVIEFALKIMKPGGLLLITVPQYGWLWGPADTVNGHFRRYSKSTLTHLLDSKGHLKINYLGSFGFFIFPLILVSKFIINRDLMSYQVTSEASFILWAKKAGLIIHPVLNWILGQMCKIDEWLIRVGFRLPFGGSLIVVAKKI